MTDFSGLFNLGQATNSAPSGTITNTTPPGGGVDPTQMHNQLVSAGIVSGAQPSTSPTQTQQPPSGGGTGGGGGGFLPGQNGYVNPNQTNNSAPVDPYAQVRQGISSAWDSYLGSLGDIGNTFLPQQQTAQQNIADSQLQQGQNTVNTQKAQSLRDIANTTRNAFQAGNNYLGSMGAGDSSAANQYSFAINQQAGKQTGDLNNYVNSQLNNLQSTHDQKINSIANWFSQQQEALKQQMAQGNLQKGQDLNSLSTNILNQAIAATNAVKANTQNQYNALTQWAANNSHSLGALQQNIAAIPQAMGQLSTFGGGVNQPNPVAYGGYAPTGGQQVKTDIFGNPIQG